MDELRVAIQAREKREAGWRPSADLLTKMAHQEAAVGLIALSKSKEWARLLEDANTHAEILTCSTIDLDWRVAEAFAGVGLLQRAYEVDAAIPEHLQEPGMSAWRRFARPWSCWRAPTSKSSSPWVSPWRTGVLSSMRSSSISRDTRWVASSPEPTMGRSPKPVSRRWGRRRCRAAIPPMRRCSAGMRSAPASIGRKPTPGSSSGLRVRAGDSKLAEGHALALGKLGRFEESEKLAFAWRERSAVMRSPVHRSGDGPARQGHDGRDRSGRTGGFHGPSSRPDRSIPGAQAIAWAGVNHKDWDAAALWVSDMRSTGPARGTRRVSPRRCPRRSSRAMPWP